MSQFLIHLGPNTTNVTMSISFLGYTCIWIDTICSNELNPFRPAARSPAFTGSVLLLRRDSLGRFPDPMIREHFLEQMRAHMVGGGGMLSAPDSPLPPRGPFWTEGSGANALDDIRVDAGQHPHLRHPQHHPSSAQHPVCVEE